MMIALLTGVVGMTGCQLPELPSFSGGGALERHDRPLNRQQVADVQISLAKSLEARGDVPAALSAYRVAIEKDPRRAKAYWRMAVLLDRQGEIEESAALYQQALKRDGKNPDILCDYGYSLYLQRRWAESEERLRQAISLKPKHARAHNHLGLLLAQTERTEEALLEFQKAGCDLSDAYSNLAFVMTLNHQWESAREQYELALDADPNSTAAQSGLEHLNAVIAKATPEPNTIEWAKHEVATLGQPPPNRSRQVQRALSAEDDSAGRSTLSAIHKRD